MTPDLHHQTVLEGFPFTLETIKTSFEDGHLYIEMKNSQQQTLSLFSNDLWQIITPSRFFDSEYWGCDEENPKVIRYIHNLKSACTELVGRQLTAICGYENFYDNTFIFDNGYIVRFMTDGDDYGGEYGNGVYLHITDEAGKEVTLGAGADDPWGDLLYPREMMSKYLPLNITTSPQEPF